MPSAEPSPRPWRVNSVIGGNIVDANGDPVCFCVGSRCVNNAALIVDAVNERDRLRDLVRRMAKIIGEAPIDWFGASFVDTQVLLTEARAAIGAGETPKGKGVGR